MTLEKVAENTSDLDFQIGTVDDFHGSAIVDIVTMPSLNIVYYK